MTWGGGKPIIIKSGFSFSRVSVVCIGTIITPIFSAYEKRARIYDNNYTWHVENDPRVKMEIPIRDSRIHDIWMM